MTLKTRLAALLASLTFLTYLTNLDGTWVLDDHYLVEKNPYITSLGHLPRVFTSNVWESSSQEKASDIYRPMMLVSYMIDRAIFGPAPWASHLGSNLLHVLNVVLLFFLAATFMVPGAAFLAALLFSVHPMAVEGVTWIGARADLLATLFTLLLCHGILAWYRDSTRKSGFYLAATALCVPLGLFSKEVFAPVLLVAALTLSLPHARNRVERYRVLLLLAEIGFSTALALHWRHHVSDRSVLSLLDVKNVRNVTAVALRFLEVFFLPWRTDFCFVYAGGDYQGVTDLIPFLFVVVAVGLLIYVGRKRLAHVLGLGIAVAALVPVVIVADLLGMVSERYFYLPLAGVALALGALADVSWKQPRRAYLYIGIAAMFFMSLTGMTIARNRDWTDEVRLYTSSLARRPDNYLPHYLLAWHFNRVGDADREIESYEAALRLKPDHLFSLNNVSVRLIERGRFEEAQKYLSSALRLDPNRAKTAYNVGFLYERMGNLTKAAEEYRRALKLEPNYKSAIAGLSRVTRAPWE